jgi:competence protein ComFB
MNKLKNYTEIMVDDLMENILSKHSNICKCNKCRLDIKAIALNLLPTRYVVTETGGLYKKIEEMGVQLQVDVTAALIEAIDQVSKYPKHDQDNKTI